jgi:sialidase-1
MQPSKRMYMFVAAFALVVPLAFAQETDWVKERDIVIYEDAKFYSAFPSAVTRPDGEVVVAFRRAPERKVFGEPGSNHTDPNSYLVQVRSKDNGETWTEPKLIHAHPYGGSQDPCMTQLRDGSIVCSSYGWALLKPEAAEARDKSLKHGNFVFMGGYIVRSEDGGHTWSDAILPPPIAGDPTLTAFGTPTPAYNRGAMFEARDGRLLWAVAARSKVGRHTENHLMTSTDGGKTWNYETLIARDDEVVFNEASIYETPKGDIVVFIRTANFDDHTVVARSADGGKSFTWEDGGFQGHPHYPLPLPDGRVLLVYGYRHEPFGVRARILDAECTNYKTAEEIVLRDDGGSTDLGYPWATMLPNGKVLVCYYFNKEVGTRHIAGTILARE